MAPQARNEVIFRPTADMPAEFVESIVALTKAALTQRGYPDAVVRVEGPVCLCPCACTMPVNGVTPAGEARCGFCRADDHYDPGTPEEVEAV